MLKTKYKLNLAKEKILSNLMGQAKTTLKQVISQITGLYATNLIPFLLLLFFKSWNTICSLSFDQLALCYSKNCSAAGLGFILHTVEGGVPKWLCVCGFCAVGKSL